MRKGLPEPVFRRLLGAIDLASPFGPRVYFMLVFLLHTGLRVGEFCSLRVQDVSRDGAPLPWLYISNQVAKFGKPRWIPLNAPRKLSPALWPSTPNAGLAAAQKRPCGPTNTTGRWALGRCSTWLPTCGRRPDCLLLRSSIRYVTPLL